MDYFIIELKTSKITKKIPSPTNKDFLEKQIKRINTKKSKLLDKYLIWNN